MLRVGLRRCAASIRTPAQDLGAVWRAPEWPYQSATVLAYYYESTRILQTYFGVRVDEAVPLVRNYIDKFMPDREDGHELIHHGGPWLFATAILGLPSHFPEQPMGYRPSNTFFYFWETGGAMSGIQSVESAERAFQRQIQHNDGNRVTFAAAVVESFHATSVPFALAIQEHGVSREVGRVNLDFSNRGQKSFYVTKIRNQAEQWMIGRYNPFGIVKFTGALPDHHLLKFTEYTKWADAVILGRQGQWTHDYDLVEGPYLMNPACVRWYSDKGVTLTEAVARGMNILPDYIPKPHGHQVAVCTDEGVEFVNTLKREYEEVLRCE